jgi:hypothetical protein
MVILKSLAAIAACGVATANAASVQSRQYKTLVTSVGCHLPNQMLIY